MTQNKSTKAAPSLSSPEQTGGGLSNSQPLGDNESLAKLIPADHTPISNHVRIAVKRLHGIITSHDIPSAPRLELEGLLGALSAIEGLAATECLLHRVRKEIPNGEA